MQAEINGSTSTGLPKILETYLQGLTLSGRGVVKISNTARACRWEFGMALVLCRELEFLFLLGEQLK